MWVALSLPTPLSRYPTRRAMAPVALRLTLCAHYSTQLHYQLSRACHHRGCQHWRSARPTCSLPLPHDGDQEGDQGRLRQDQLRERSIGLPRADEPDARLQVQAGNRQGHLHRRGQPSWPACPRASHLHGLWFCSRPLRVRLHLLRPVRQAPGAHSLRPHAAPKGTRRLASLGDGGVHPGSLRCWASLPHQALHQQHQRRGLDHRRVLALRGQLLHQRAGAHEAVGALLGAAHGFHDAQLGRDDRPAGHQLLGRRQQALGPRLGHDC